MGGYGTGDVELEALATVVVDAALQVHRLLGPGLLESVYQACLCHELTIRGVGFERQVALPLRYKDLIVEGGLRLDLLVGGRLVVELKSVEVLLAVHKAQVITYLRLSGLRLGLLINFNVPLIKDGIKRVLSE